MVRTLPWSRCARRPPRAPSSTSSRGSNCRRSASTGDRQKRPNYNHTDYRSVQSGSNVGVHRRYTPVGLWQPKTVSRGNDGSWITVRHVDLHRRPRAINQSDWRYDTNLAEFKLSSSFGFILRCNQFLSRRHEHYICNMQCVIGDSGLCTRFYIYVCPNDSNYSETSSRMTDIPDVSQQQQQQMSQSTGMNITKGHLSLCKCVISDRHRAVLLYVYTRSHVRNCRLEHDWVLYDNVVQSNKTDTRTF